MHHNVVALMGMSEEAEWVGMAYVVSLSFSGLANRSVESGQWVEVIFFKGIGEDLECNVGVNESV